MIRLIHFLKPPYHLYGFIFRNQGGIVEKVISIVLVVYVLAKKYKKDLHSGIDGSIIILLLLFITYFIIMNSFFKWLLFVVAVVCSMVWVVCRAEDKCIWQDNMYAVSLKIIDNQIRQSASGDVDSLRMQLAYKARIISLMRNNKYCLLNVK